MTQVMRSGCVFWITGFSGCGKTTVARLLLQKLKAQGIAALLLDGDILRTVFGETRHDAGYTLPTGHALCTAVQGDIGAGHRLGLCYNIDISGCAGLEPRAFSPIL